MEELHRFIQHLDSNEKKYFRRFGLKDESKGNSQTSELFELLDAIEVYDEGKIENRIKRLKLDKQINHTKNYLFGLLTETITWYHRERFTGLSNAYELAKIQLLEEKGLYQEAEKKSVKVIKQALEQGTFADRWDAFGYSIQVALNNFLSDKKKEPTETNELIEQREKLLNEMNRFHAYDSLLKQQQIIIRKAMQARNPEDLKLLNQIMENELVQQVDFATSPEAKFVFYTLRIQYFNIVGQREKLLIDAENLVELTKNSISPKISTMNKLWAYSQLSQALYFTSQWDKLESCLEELSNVSTYSSTESIAKFSYHTQLAVPLLDHKKDAVALKKLLHEVKGKLQSTGNELRADVRMVITLTCVSGFVEYEEYKQAIDVCEHFLTHHDSGVRLDIMLTLYAYEFISHLELGNMVYVNNVTQNVARYFNRNDYKGKFETTLLHVFKKISEMRDYLQHQKEIQKLKEELNESSVDASNTQHFGVLPIVNSFLDSKLTERKTKLREAKR